MIDGEIMQVDPETLITEVLKLKHRDYRLIQICAANAGDGIDITYSFGKEYKMVGLRLSIMPEEEIVSISDIYAPAYLYENEMHDLFGVKVKMMSTDYHGNLYRLKHKTPYREKTAASQPAKAAAQRPGNAAAQNADKAAAAQRPEKAAANQPEKQEEK